MTFTRSPAAVPARPHPRPASGQPLGFYDLDARNGPSSTLKEATFNGTRQQSSYPRAGPYGAADPAAQLKITAEPAEVTITARRFVTAEGTVPPGRHVTLSPRSGSSAASSRVSRRGPHSAHRPWAHHSRPGRTGTRVAGAVLIAVCGLVQGRNQAEEKPREILKANGWHERQMNSWLT